MEKIIENAMQKLAKEVDDYALMVFKIPNWILKRRWLLKFYFKFYKLTIESQRNSADLSDNYRFFKYNKKVGELKIKDIFKLN